MQVILAETAFANIQGKPKASFGFFVETLFSQVRTQTMHGLSSTGMIGTIMGFAKGQCLS